MEFTGKKRKEKKKVQNEIRAYEANGGESVTKKRIAKGG